MSSEGRTAREAQGRDYENAITQRLAMLQEKGLEDEIIQKDRQIRHLRAELRRTNRRLFRISQIEKQNESLASRKGSAREEEQAAPSPDPGES